MSYAFRPAANRLVKKNREWIKPDDPGGRGTEIVRELLACPRCAGVA